MNYLTRLQNINYFLKENINY